MSTSITATPLLHAASLFYRDLPLIKAILSTATHSLYDKALKEFNAALGSTAPPVRSIDAALCDFAHALYAERPTPGNKQTIINAISALSHRAPGLRSRLAASRKAVKGWGKFVPFRQAMPLSRDLCCAMCGELLRCQWSASAACLLLCWDGMLRASEAISLEKRHIELPGDERLSATPTVTAGVLVLNSKTGPRQLVMIKDTKAIALLRDRLDNVGSCETSSLFPITYSTLLLHVREAARRLSLDPQEFTTHSARHGGAIHRFSSGDSVEQIVVHGRWAALSSLRRYIANGRARALELNLSSRTSQRTKQARRRLDLVVSAKVIEQQTKAQNASQ